ncbi:glucan endo-1,3-beta-glucosidase 4-like isoform X2 [Phoenix dactylifera]|uniref:Glucan endo-1,3-beta-glucosidase 4-like isoform X2 n=1 Tax=Phoenix dactylifera TaxID=42345 RepID=A0A8B8Z8B4_PHODC|nr:glucan endo-1,3-beta-glucosidase 4-like isoform X2 [Phoenix dactylifera]
MRVVEFYFYLLISPLPLLGLTGQEAIQPVNLREPNQFSLHLSPHTTSPLPIAVSVTEAELSVVSSSVLAAESWLKTHVLAPLSSTRITTIELGKGVLCDRNHEHQWSLVLPSVKNLYYCLVRRGLLEKIKLSAAFSSNCFHHLHFSLSGGDLKQGILNPLLGFLQDNTMVYSIDSSSEFSHPPDNYERVYSVHRVASEELGFSKLPPPFMLPSPRTPLSPIPFAPVPDSHFSFVPSAAPSEIPTNPPDAPRVPSPLPNASPSRAPAGSPLMSVFPPPSPAAPVTPHSPAAPSAQVPIIPAFPPVVFPPLAPCSVPAPEPAPGPGEEQKGGLWCVAKPAVPAEKLQEAMDYACGEGGADCEEIRPNGSCYYPDTVVAHASYALNSCWQKTKHAGGTCSFDGTAILITSDPSFQQCRFIFT